MRKLIITLLCIITFGLIPLPVNAQQSLPPTAEGYTPDGIHYIVYEIETNADTQKAIGDKITVLRTFQYSGILQPPSKQNYSEMIDGIYYTGVIELVSFTFENGNTIATYQGTLNAIN